MGQFSALGVFRAAASQMLAGITDILSRIVDGKVQLFTTTRAGGGILALELTETGLALRDQQALAVTRHLPAAAQLSLVEVTGKPQLLWSGGWTTSPGGFDLPDAGGIGGAFTYRRGPQGIVTAHVVVGQGEATFVVSAVKETGRLEASRLSETGILQSTGGQEMFGAGEQMADLRDMATVEIGGRSYVITLSNVEDSMRVWSLSDEGILRVASRLGASAGLGIAAPSALEVVQANGTTWAIAAGSGSSSISVMEVTPAGVLRLRDHIIDTMETRFQRVEALATAVVQGRIFVFAGGADGGLQALMLLPDGRLVSLDMIEGRAALPIDNLTAIEAVVVAGQIELVLAGERVGLTRLRFDPGDPAPEQRGGAGRDTLTGGARDDLLSGGAGDDALTGGAGADVLLDGAGSDTLRGGDGADIFVLARDGDSDVIRDFDPAEDRIDLSGWGRVYSARVLSITERNGAVLIRWGDEALTIYSASGQGLSKSLFNSARLFGLWHVVDPDPVAGIELSAAGPGQETLTGGAGDDSFRGRDSGDLLIGGAGADLVDYGDLAQGVRASLMTPAPLGGSSGLDRFSAIEHLAGSRFADVLIGNSGANNLWGHGGHDLLEGQAGKDRLYGGDGNDTLSGGPGADRLYGGAGLDVASWAGSVGAIRVDLARGVITGGDATGDTLAGIEGFIGGAGRDTLIGDASHNLLNGGAGGDSLVGGGGHDSLWGEAGDDTLLGGPGDDRLDGGLGVDLIVYEGRAAVLLDLGQSLAQKTGAHGTDLVIGIEHVLTGWGNDTVTGSALANRLDLGSGNDRAYGGAGRDTLLGGRGADLLEGGIDDDLLRGDLDGDTLRGGDGQDQLYGDDGNDVLSGDAGQDTLYGGAGADRLNGAAGNDRLFGGTGADVLSGDDGNDTLMGEAENDRLLGLAGHDHLYGGAGNNVLDGGEGDDLLVGDLGSDTLSGGAGNDQLFAGAGFASDRIDGGAGVDLAVFAGPRAFRIDLRQSGPQDTGAGRDILIGIEFVTTGSGHDRVIGSALANRIMTGLGNDRVEGGAGNDTVLGGSGSDWLIGDSGNDLLYGEASNDRLAGGAGNDRLSGGSGMDIAIYSGKAALRVTLEHSRPQQTGQGRDQLIGIEGLQGAGGADRLTGNRGKNQLAAMAGNDTLRGLAGDDRLSGGKGNDRLQGGSGNDRLLGEQGRDILEGGDGRDRLNGGTGNDTLRGGRGADDFVFSGGHDRISDFSRSQGDDLLLDRAALPFLRGMSVGRILDRWGEDRGRHVALDFGPKGEIEIYGISTLTSLRHVIELI